MRTDRLTFLILLWAFLTIMAVGQTHRDPPLDLLDPRLPLAAPDVDPDTAGWRALTLLRGVGARRAATICRERSRFGVPLTRNRLPLVTGIGGESIAIVVEPRKRGD